MTTIKDSIPIELRDEITTFAKHVLSATKHCSAGEQRAAVLITIVMLLLGQDGDTVEDVFDDVRAELTAYARWQAGTGRG